MGYLRRRAGGLERGEPPALAAGQERVPGRGVECGAGADDPVKHGLERSSDRRRGHVDLARHEDGEPDTPAQRGDLRADDPRRKRLQHAPDVDEEDHAPNSFLPQIQG